MVIYVITMLWYDTNDNQRYDDILSECFTDFEKAKAYLDSEIMEEYNNLIKNGGDYYITDYNDNGCYEREIWFENSEYEDMLMRYTIRKVNLAHNN
jgi:hypothetical protein